MSPSPSSTPSARSAAFSSSRVTASPGSSQTAAGGQEARDPPLVHPGDGVPGEPGLALAAVAVVPGPALQPPPMVAGSEDEDVTFTELDPLRAFGRLQLLAGDRLAGLQP